MPIDLRLVEYKDCKEYMHIYRDIYFDDQQKFPHLSLYIYKN